MIKTENLKNFIQINNDSFDIPLVAYYVASYEEYPSAFSFKEHMDVTKVYNAIFEHYGIKEEDIVGLRAKDANGLVLFEDMVCELGEKFMLRIYNRTGVSKHIRTERLYYEDDQAEELEANCAQLLFDFGFNAKTVPFAKIQEFEKLIEPFKLKPQKKGQINIVVNNQSEGLHLKEFKIKKSLVDIELNYGKEFKEVHDIIFNRLNNKEDHKGIVLLYGDPGTGKTSYIRHLINSIEDKKVIYLTPDLANMISEPSFITFLMDHPNSILIIEDGENILRSRKSGANQSVANLLNLADGLLSDALNMQIVCTFNCDIGDVDSALMRKGRMIAKHCFKPLNKEEAQKVSDSLGFKTIIEDSMSLADIYNQNDKDFNEDTKDSHKPIGFGK